MSDLAGASDLHLHTGPDLHARWYDDVEAAQLAEQHRMYAIVLKSHWTATADRAITATRLAGIVKARVYGGLVLNFSVGGMNPDAVEKSLSMGAKIIWMPTHDAAYHRRQDGRGGGINITETYGGGNLLDVTRKIVDMCIDSRAAIATSHISPHEIRALAEYGMPRGARIVVTHPEEDNTRLPHDAQQHLAKMGVMLERCYVGRRDVIPAIAAGIRSVGPESTVLSSDLGMKSGPKPFSGLIEFYELLSREGVSSRDLDLMTCQNPHLLLD